MVTNRQQDERLTDLLAAYSSDSDQSPGMYLGGGSTARGGSQSLLQNLAEVRASNVEKAAFYLDAALSNRSKDTQVGWIDRWKVSFVTS